MTELCVNGLVINLWNFGRKKFTVYEGETKINAKQINKETNIRG
jgi:hypothetical protein